MLTREKPPKNGKTSCIAYISEDRKKEWVKHLQRMRPRYQSLSHMIEANVEYGIRADNYGPNKIIGKIGAMK